MGKQQQVDILIIGGGLAGLINAIHLSKAGLQVILLEKNEYPKHKVCGEYISQEVLPYLQYLGIDPFALGATTIKRITLSAHNGKAIQGKLPMGGFGISRYTLDHYLFQQALAFGCQVKKATVSAVEWSPEQYKIQTLEGEYYRARVLVGAFGKRSNLDVKLNRPFIQKKAPFLAVKNHFRGDFPEDLVALHNFQGGYCGISKVENGFINICYLADYSSFKQFKNIDVFQRAVLYKNPHLEEAFETLQAVFPKPISISQVSFSAKKAVEQHIFMSGDTAGMIHPLCGNGMAMAIHSAKILSELLIRFFHKKNSSLFELEQEYSHHWQKAFQKRLLAGHLFQSLFRQDRLFEKLIYGLTFVPFLLPAFIRRTHGKELKPSQM